MLSSNISSMVAHSGWLNNTAHNVANVNTQKVSTISSNIEDGVTNNPKLRTDTGANNQVDGKSAIDLTKEMTDMVVSSKGFAANAPVVKTQDEMLGTLLNIKA